MRAVLSAWTKVIGLATFFLNQQNTLEKRFAVFFNLRNPPPSLRVFNFLMSFSGHFSIRNFFTFASKTLLQPPTFEACVPRLLRKTKF